MAENASKNGIVPRGGDPIQFVACHNCGSPTHPDDLMPCMGYRCCLACRDMTRMLVIATKQTASSLPPFAEFVMKHAAKRTGKATITKKRAYQECFGQVAFRKGVA